ncbi:MAG: hypothetical protein ACR2MN_16245 [Acidimicrobiales bacterium]
MADRWSPPAAEPGGTRTGPLLVDTGRVRHRDPDYDRTEGADRTKRNKPTKRNKRSDRGEPSRSGRDYTERDYGERPVAAGGKLTAGLTALGLLTILTGAWGGIVAYIGPTFGYSSNGVGSWSWTWQHSLLYLIPGAVAVFCGLLLWGAAARTRGGSGRVGPGFAGLLIVASGAWFVLGPLVWAMFYTTPVVFGPASATANFINQLGYNVGTGVVLAVLGGMTLALAGASRHRLRAAV